jgi:hypothetical protein
MWQAAAAELSGEGAAGRPVLVALVDPLLREAIIKR